MNSWTEADIPDLTGRVAVVTGANTGLGFETARALAEHGARVVLACRDRSRAEDAARRITERSPGTSIDCVELDLADLSSVRAAAATIRSRFDRIDLLINNAGVTGLTGRTEDGFEIQFGINHLGHFALTGLLIDRIVAAAAARVVTVSSIGHRFGRIDAADPAATTGNSYAKSKLANLMFTYELDRRLAGTPAEALAAHPGAPAPRSSATRPPRSGYRIWPSLVCSAVRPPWARCRRCAPPPILPRRAANTTARQVFSRSADSRDRPRPPSVRTSATARLGCGRYPKN